MAKQGGDPETEERIKGRVSGTQEQEKLQDRRGGRQRMPHDGPTESTD